MSYRPDYISTFKASRHHQGSRFLENKSYDDLRNLFLEILYGGIHGVCFSLYEDGQKPGDVISESQIRRRMGILKPFTQWIRSFSCIEGNEHIPVIAREHGLKTLVGAWLGTDEEMNRQEIANLISLARNGFVDVAAVGNEVLYRKDLSKEELLGYIRQVKTELPGIPVGYVDAYYEFTENQDIADACDLILCNCYPFWEGTAFDLSLQHLEHMFHQASLAAKGKRVIITETGWPTRGENTGNATPSHDIALKYFLNTQLWAMDVNAEVFYFSSFDESWKVGAEGEVGAFWGIWDKNEKLKF